MFLSATLGKGIGVNIAVLARLATIRKPVISISVLFTGPRMFDVIFEVTRVLQSHKLWHLFLLYIERDVIVCVKHDGGGMYKDNEVCLT